MRRIMKRRLSFVAALALCFFSASNAAAYAQQVKADTGGVAIGGSVNSSTINIGIPPQKVDELVREGKRPLEELTAQPRENIALLKEKLDLNLGQVRAALNIVGENNIPPERLGAKLVEIAERFKDLQTIASAQPGDSPAIVSLKAQAQKATEAGELAKADALLADVEAEQRRALDHLAVNAAETSARRGHIALTRLRYAEAAKHFANAAAAFPPNSAHSKKRIGYLWREANALYRQGDELGDNGALLAAIEQLRRLVDLTPRERVPLDWARTKNTLGVALMRLGQRESGPTRLEEAVAALREALKELTRGRVPLQWARVQSNLGTALTSLGQREAGTAKLEEAIVAYREALKVRTRERVPLEWALTQTDLGVVLTSLGDREGGVEKYEEAIVAYREALKERTRERVPLEWANAGLGLALSSLGQREDGTAKLEEAIVAYRDALKEQTRERVPLEWARAQQHLGIALTALGDREGGVPKYEEALVAYREAQKELTRERVPLDWARCFGMQGVVLIKLAERRGDASLAETGLSQINAAFETLRDGGHAAHVGFYERQLAKARATVARLRGE